jgi:hypothetical protein
VQKLREKTPDATRESISPHPEQGGVGVETRPLVVTAEPKKAAATRGGRFDGISDVGSPLGGQESPSKKKKSATSGRSEVGVETEVGGFDGVSAGKDPLLASLEAAAADALHAHDWTTVTAIGLLIDKRVQALAAAAPPKVASLADARKRRDEKGEGKP